MVGMGDELLTQGTSIPDVLGLTTEAKGLSGSMTTGALALSEGGKTRLINQLKYLAMDMYGLSRNELRGTKAERPKH
jgi:hypothetical protein